MLQNITKNNIMWHFKKVQSQNASMNPEKSICYMTMPHNVYNVAFLFYNRFFIPIYPKTS